MDENNKPQSDFDLDAALAEKFQQVQQDANRLRAMNDNTDTPASSPVPEGACPDHHFLRLFPPLPLPRRARRRVPWDYP